jgi:antirestriction protein ArdC
MTALPQSSHLLSRALAEPGVVSRAYSAFHDYSVGNQLLALVQCVERGISPGPMATFVGWKQKGRHVKKGERAIVLCMPITAKRNSDAEAGGHDSGKAPTFTRFVVRPKWFVLAQTDGEPLVEPPIPNWDAGRALGVLGIEEVTFDYPDGNCLGFARGTSMAINPANPMPHKTRFHELAHVVLGHTAENGSGLTDSELTPRSLREVEAEAVALVCLEALGLPGADHCRGYIQLWNARRGAAPIPERCAQRVLKAADHILKAGVDPI